jgi:FAD/FMN-containing dehydrogenase
VLEAFDHINRSSLYTDMLYFPVTDEIEILSIDPVKDGDVSNLHDATSRALKQPAGQRITRVRQTLMVPALKLVAWVLMRANTIQRFVTTFAVGSSYRVRSGRSDWVLAYGDQEDSGRSPGTIRDMEVAISYAEAPAAIKLLRRHFQATRTFPLMPIHIRSSARSALWLSPAYGRDVVWVECWQFPRSAVLFDQIHELLKPFHYRFHWGKEARATREYIRVQYERWDDFAKLRDEWDPHRVFLNDYLEPFFGESAMHSAQERRMETS